MAFEIRLDSRAEELLAYKLDPWANPAMLEAVASVHDLDARYLTVYKGEELLAVWPLYIRKRFGIKYLVCPTTAYYQALQFFFAPGRAEARNELDKLKICREIAKFLKTNFSLINIKADPGLIDLRGFSEARLKVGPLYTYVLDYPGELELLKDEAKSLAEAEARDYQWTMDYKPEAYLGLHEQMLERKGKAHTLGLGALGRYFEILHRAGLLRQGNVVRSGRIVSADMLIASESGTAYTVYRASEPAELKHGVSIWHSVRLVRELAGSYDRLDFCGANVPEVARFKAAMGLKLCVFYKITGRGKWLDW